MRVLVVGASGAIGRPLGAQLVAAGHTADRNEIPPWTTRG